MPRRNRQKQYSYNDNVQARACNQLSKTSQSDLSSNKNQRDMLIDLLYSSKLSCVICCDQIKRTQLIWHCRKCFQIIHLSCINSWYRNSLNTDFTWRCPLCQNTSNKTPSCKCFCGYVTNPLPNEKGRIPHSCGLICGLTKKNENSDIDDCYHSCKLKCHPGPCPQCMMKVLKKCCCGKTRARGQCGVPRLCENKCSKELNCMIHHCEKQCHVGQCAPCEKEHDLYPVELFYLPREFMLMVDWFQRSLTRRT